MGDALFIVEQHVKRGRLEQAEQKLRRFLRSIPRHPQALSLLCRIHTLRQDWMNAAEVLQRLCDLQPRSTFHWVRLIHCFLMAGAPERAQAALQSAADAGMDVCLIERLEEQLAHPPLIRQQLLLSQYQEGTDVLTCEIAAHLFITDYPDHPLGWQILGALQHNSARYEAALETQRRTVERFPKDANAWNNLAHTQLITGRAKAALDSAGKALSLDPTHVSAAACRHRAKAQIDDTEQTGGVTS